MEQNQDRNNFKLTAYVLAHEVLHSLGADDVDNPNDVMSYLQKRWLEPGNEPTVGEDTIKLILKKFGIK